MNRYLAIGYVLSALIFLADIALMRWVFPIPRYDALLIVQLLHSALLPTSILLFIGSRRSIGLLRKILGYSLCAFAGFGGIGACVGVALTSVRAGGASSRLTIHSSRHRFAVRLNSGVRPL